mmetsp:Transcript_2703/g.2352  ORF Transcript_2703/g.2352 Transcript_2703/m.2352 type:complete len:157 (+) Transcript_2703:630-1100(+)
MGSSFLIINLEEDNKESIAFNNQDGQADGNNPGNMLQNRDTVKSKKGSTTGYSELTIKIFGGPNYGEVYHFNSNQSNVIKVGRMPDCDIRIEDNLLSKYQCSVNFQPGKGWQFVDGYNGKPSTNSNWLYLNEDYEMYTGMIFKANHTLFHVTLEKP